MSRLRVLILLVVALALAGGTWGLHFWLGRPGRIAAEARRVALFEVRDQVLRYEVEHGALPATLDALQGAYLRADQLCAPDGSSLYAYNADERSLKEARAPMVTGLWSYALAPREAALPPPDVQMARQPDPASKTQAEPTSAPPAPVVPQLPARIEIKEPLVAPGPVDLLKSNAWTTLQGPELPDAPAGALVFEAEHFSDTNYGWEIRADAACGGGAYLHCKEGIANGPGQTRSEMGDFYNERATKEVTHLKYHFHAPKTGDYYILGRMWTTDTKCSNSICMGLDEGGPYTGGGMENRTPFRWVWSPMKNNPVRLTQGDHYLHLFIHEDGVRIDQFAMLPRSLDGGAAYKANFETGAGTDWREKLATPVQLSFDYKSMVIAPEQPPEVRVAVRKLKDASGRARFKAWLEHAALDGTDLTLADGELDLAQLPQTGLLALDFKSLDLARLPRREYLLRAEVSLDGRVLAACRTPLLKPWAWEVFGPGRFYGIDDTTRLDGDGDPRDNDKRTWTPFGIKSWDHFGVLDFGMQFYENSLHPKHEVTAFARTRIKVPKSGKYLFKIQSDDQMILWIDGKEVFRHQDTQPVTRGGRREVLQLEGGEHRVRFRLNQYEGRWQAAIRIRNEDDTLSEIIGLEP